MSIPISACLLAKAAFDSPGARERLAERAAYNKKFGGFSFWPCEHEPPCPEPSAEQLHALAIDIPDIAPLIVALLTPAEEAIVLNQESTP